MKPRIVSVIGWIWLIGSISWLLQIIISSVKVTLSWALLSAVYQGPPVHGLENTIKASSVLFQNMKLILGGGILLGIFSLITSVNFLRLKQIALKSMKFISLISIFIISSGWIWFVTFKAAADSDGVGLKHGNWGHVFFAAFLIPYLLTLWGLRSNAVTEAFAKE